MVSSRLSCFSQRAYLEGKRRRFMGPSSRQDRGRLLRPSAAFGSPLPRRRVQGSSCKSGLRSRLDDQVFVLASVHVVEPVSMSSTRSAICCQRLALSQSNGDSLSRFGFGARSHFVKSSSEIIASKRATRSKYPKSTPANSAVGIP